MPTGASSPMMRAASISPTLRLSNWLAVGALMRQTFMVITHWPVTCANYSQPLTRRDRSRRRFFAAHVVDQGILKGFPKFLNLLVSQLHVTNLADGLRQLVGYMSGQDSGPFSFGGDDGLRHHVPPGSSKKHSGESIYPAFIRPSSYFQPGKFACRRRGKEKMA